MKQKIAFTYILSACLLWGVTYLLNQTQLVQSEGPRFLAPPPDHIEHFTFGFRESMADSLWLRWIQDCDVCQTYQGVAQPTANVEQPEQFANPRHKICDNSWSFKMLDAVTRLAPRFVMPYEFGAVTLAVLSEDYAGASVIFDRGIEQYPENWEILYRAGYHFLFDMNDMPKAAGLFERVVKAGAPDWLNLLAARLYTQSGQLEMGLVTLKAYRETVKDNPEGLKQINKRIADLEKKLSESKTEQ